MTPEDSARIATEIKDMGPGDLARLTDALGLMLYDAPDDPELRLLAAAAAITFDDRAGLA
ncbi:hypothetical protein L7D48_13470 [Streptomyces sp. S1A]|uniref:hypothetical protein n=1 Tax=Streptomyces sp. ICN903 TaxID=2964654 RepID=UPI001EDB2B55|nr:hypothetical protein [Streptomyces sp. ICN903]MCG3041559.1 hypothetical protein [Streptomyces sp. ICN903]